MRKRIVKKIFYSIIFSLCWSIVVTAQVNQAVTYWDKGGRFGDRIMAYVFAKWISYKFNIPLLYKPFHYSFMLRLSRDEKKYSQEIAKQFRNKLQIGSNGDVIRHRKNNALFIIRGVYFRIAGCRGLEQTIKRMLQDKYFVTELQNMIQPIDPLPQINLPQDKVTVAVHIRKWEFDDLLDSIQYYSTKFRIYVDRKWPLKFPPEQYYVDQIKKISTLFDDVPLFMHIFTDDPNPLGLVSRIKEAVNKENITFSCRQSGNAHNAHVIEDFYNMSRFDCLIRSGSHFGISAQLLGNHKVIIYPKHWKWEDRKLIIDEVSIIDNRAG